MEIWGWRKIFDFSEPQKNKNFFEVKIMKRYKVSVVIEKDEGGYFAFSPELQGSYAPGETYEEVIENIKDVIRIHIEDRIESEEAIPEIEYISLTSLEVEVWAKNFPE